METELAPHASTLYVFFGGMAAGIVIPRFEFYNASRIVDEHKMFVRDFDRCWYHAGLAGVSRDIDSMAAYLRERIEEISPRRTVFVGNSMGGYAAMLFAALLGEAEVIAFAPQTFLSPWLRWRHQDHRWRPQIRRMWRRGLMRRRFWDLKPLLMRRHSRPGMSVYVSDKDRLDMIHAGRLRDVPGMHIHTFAEGGHDVVRHLRDAGQLAHIMGGTHMSSGSDPMPASARACRPQWRRRRQQMRQSVHHCLRVVFRT